MCVGTLHTVLRTIVCCSSIPSNLAWRRNSQLPCCTSIYLIRIDTLTHFAAEVESPITRREVENALRGMPEKKSPGPDGITTQMLVAAGKIGILELTELSNMIHNQGTYPNELNKSIFITLPKVNGTIKCEKHRTISLMSHVTKLVLRIVINRIRGRTLDEIAPVQ